MISKAELVRVVKQYPILDEIHASGNLDLLDNSVIFHIPSGSIIFDENQLCQGFPLILSGSIRVIKAAPNGRELLLYRVLPGESCILTSSCLLGNTNYTARGIAEHDLEIVMLPALTFRRMLEKYESFRIYVFQLFSERMTDLMQLVSAVAFQKLDHRLANLLIMKANPIHSTHQALSDELGCAREIVTRLLKNFADQGWIKIGREQIDIIDMDALKNFASL